MSTIQEQINRVKEIMGIPNIKPIKEATSFSYDEIEEKSIEEEIMGGIQGG